MAIRFNTSSLSSDTHNVYTINKFNGVDYTTTPSMVDDTRAIEMSNYLPKGDSLVKRNGFESVGIITHSDGVYSLLNVWKFGATKDKTRDYYLSFVAKKVNETTYSDFRLMITYIIKGSDLEFTSVNTHAVLNINKTLNKEEIYCYAVEFEGKYFVLVDDNYYVISINKNGTYDCKEAKDVAYIPTILTGVGAEQLYLHGTVKEKDESGTEVEKETEEFTPPTYTSNTLEEINLLKNTVKIELLRYNSMLDENNDLCIAHYAIGKFLRPNITITELLINGAKYIENDDGFFTLNGEDYQLWYMSNKESDTKVISPNFKIKDNEQFEGYVLSLKTNKKTFHNDELYVTIEVSYTFDDGTDPSEIVRKMRFGMPYGANGNNDSLFLSGNPEYPNIDVRTCNASFAEEKWKTYTYFGDNSYTSIGTSSSKIVGYGIANNGDMVVFKESVNNQPNIYSRRSTYSEDSEGNMIENFPVSNSGLCLDITDKSKIITFGNDLLVSTKYGLVQVVLGEYTATQSYIAHNVSYFIRENINENLTGNFLFTYKNNLYWYKQDIEGEYRLYVADYERYGYINDKRVYEWWVLDDIKSNGFFVQNNKLYFYNDKGLFTFTNSFVDVHKEYITDIHVGNVSTSSSVFIVNNEGDKLILSPSHDVFKEIIKSKDVKNAYQEMKSASTISFDGKSLIETDVIPEITNIENSDNYKLIATFNPDEEKSLINNIYNSILQGALEIVHRGNRYYLNNLEDISLITNENKTVTLECIVSKYSTGISENNEYLCFSEVEKINYEIDELYTILEEKEYALSDCEFIGEDIYYVNENDENIYLGNINVVYFNVFTLKYKGHPVKFIAHNLTHVIFNISFNVKAYWRSKYNNLGKLDTLKTVDKLIFETNPRRDGKTYVGYRTYNKTTSYYSKNVNFQLNFDIIDFNIFSFSDTDFSRTQTSKKKVKNFSFIQFQFNSLDNEDSSIVSLTIRYKYTKTNKGVK